MLKINVYTHYRLPTPIPIKSIVDMVCEANFNFNVTFHKDKKESLPHSFLNKINWPLSDLNRKILLKRFVYYNFILIRC